MIEVRNKKDGGQILDIKNRGDWLEVQTTKQRAGIDLPMLWVGDAMIDKTQALDLIEILKTWAKTGKLVESDDDQ